MTYVCSGCGHDFTEHVELGVGEPWPCDHEGCDCPNYDEA